MPENRTSVPGDQKTAGAKVVETRKRALTGAAILRRTALYVADMWAGAGPRRVRHSTVSLRGVGEAARGPDNEPLERAAPTVASDSRSGH